MKKHAHRITRRIAARDASFDNSTIVVLHDLPPVRSIFSCLVEWLGYPVQEAGCLAEAQRLFSRRASVVAVVSAFHLPDGNSWEFMKKLRARNIATPFLCVSGEPPTLDEHSGFEFLSMPLRKDEFDRSIRRMVRLSETMKAERREGVEVSCN